MSGCEPGSRTPWLVDLLLGVALLLGVVVVAVCLVERFNAATHHEWDFGLAFSAFVGGPLSRALWTTLRLAVASIVLSLVIGTVTGAIARSPSRVVRLAIRGYVELIRGTPLLIQVLVLDGFVTTALGIPRFWGAALAFGIFGGAFVSEALRAGIDAVAPGEIEAAKSLGMTRWKVLRTVVLPQAFATMLPPLAGIFMSLIKDTSLAYVIAIEELTNASRQQAQSTGAVFEIYLLSALLYLALTVPLSSVARILEGRNEARR